MSTRFPVLQRILLGLLCASLVTNVLLAVRVNVLLNHMKTRSTTETWTPPRAPAGTVFPPLRLRDREGKPATIGFSNDARPTVVYLLDPKCGWCERNAANIVALAEQAGARFRFVGVATKESGLGEFLRRYPVPFEVFSQPDEATRSAYRMGAVPRTMVISTTGELEVDFPGAYLPFLQEEVQRYFGARLPGLLAGNEGRGTTGIGGGQEDGSAYSNCTDGLGQEFSPGWISELDGRRQVCGRDGRWKVME